MARAAVRVRRGRRAVSARRASARPCARAAPIVQRRRSRGGAPRPAPGRRRSDDGRAAAQLAGQLEARRHRAGGEAPTGLAASRAAHCVHGTTTFARLHGGSSHVGTAGRNLILARSGQNGLTSAMARRSAGILLFRRTHEGVEVLLVHPGGPFWARRDAGAWSIPKGEHDAGRRRSRGLRAAGVRGGDGQDARAGRPRAARRGEAEERQGGAGLGGRGRPRRGGDPQQHVRARVAAALGPPAGVPRGRPRRVVPARPGAREAHPGAGGRSSTACSSTSDWSDRSTRGGTRTHTPSRAAAFKPTGCTSSPTRAACPPDPSRAGGYAETEQLLRSRRVLAGGQSLDLVEVSALNHAGVAGTHGRSPLLRLQSDERLIALVRRGNHHAFEALVEPLPGPPARLLPPHAQQPRGRGGRAAGGLRRRLQRDRGRRAADQRAPVAVPDRPQPLAQPPAQGPGDRRRLDGRPPLRARPDDGRQGAQARGVPPADERRRQTCRRRSAPRCSCARSTRSPTSRSPRRWRRRSRRSSRCSCAPASRSPRRPRRGCSRATRCARSSARSPRACAARRRRSAATCAPASAASASASSCARPTARWPRCSRSGRCSCSRRRCSRTSARPRPARAARPPPAARRGGRARRRGGRAAARCPAPLASKAVAGLAAAAIVTAGAVEVKHVTRPPRADRAAAVTDRGRRARGRRRRRPRPPRPSPARAAAPSRPAPAAGGAQARGREGGQGQGGRRARRPTRAPRRQSRTRRRRPPRPRRSRPRPPTADAGVPAAPVQHEGDTVFLPADAAAPAATPVPCPSSRRSRSPARPSPPQTPPAATPDARHRPRPPTPAPAPTPARPRRTERRPIPALLPLPSRRPARRRAALDSPAARAAVAPAPGRAPSRRIGAGARLSGSGPRAAPRRRAPAGSPARPRRSPRGRAPRT